MYLCQRSPRLGSPLFPMTTNLHPYLLCWKPSCSSPVKIRICMSVRKHPHGVLMTQKLRFPSVDKPELTCSTFKAWSRPDCSHTCFAHCEEFIPCPNCTVCDFSCGWWRQSLKRDFHGLSMHSWMSILKHGCRQTALHFKVVGCVCLAFTPMPDKSYRKRLRFVLLCLFDVIRALINSLVCWFCSGALGLVLRLYFTHLGPHVFRYSTERLCYRLYSPRQRRPAPRRQLRSRQQRQPQLCGRQPSNHRMALPDIPPRGGDICATDHYDLINDDHIIVRSGDYFNS